ncbi:MAG: hypothetical protein HY791_07105 [Deltaproteobacteria bacterium]|nr:hypothetical protein [Deltaproteobacteria bacterium]
MRKHRFSASVDEELYRAAEKAVADGLSDSVSAWINTAMRAHLDRERRMRALDAWITAFEAEHGEITDTEMTAVARRDRERAIVVRDGKVLRASKKKGSR